MENLKRRQKNPTEIFSPTNSGKICKISTSENRFDSDTVSSEPILADILKEISEEKVRTRNLSR